MFNEYADIIPEFSLFQESLLNPLPTYLTINRLRVDPTFVVETLRKRGISLIRASKEYDTLYLAPNLPFPGNLLEYFLGYLHPQALTSAMAAYALDPEKNTSLLDMCASPGGKSAHCAQIMENTGIIVSNDLYASRHLSLGHTLSRLGVLNAVLTGYQAQEFPLKQRFDYVMADVPCSGEGRFRKTNEKVQYRKGRGREKLPDLQKRIILRGFDLLKKNGRMLYSTCTYSPEENESVVDYLLNERDADLFPLYPGLNVAPGITDWKGKTYDKRLKCAKRYYPHRVDSVGFFMAGIGRKQ
jgi:NOL1/NOP2/sun family putative RNA methylase